MQNAVYVCAMIYVVLYSSDYLKVKVIGVLKFWEYWEWP